MVQITKEGWDTVLKGWGFYDCTIAGEEYGFVLMRNGFENIAEGEEYRAQFLVKAHDTFRNLESEFLGASNISCIPKNKNNLFLMIDVYGRSLFSDTDDRTLGAEDKIKTKLPKTDIVSAFMNIVRVEQQLFAVASPSGIYRRIDDSKWKREKLPILFDKSDLAIQMHDLSGFSLTDMYAVADEGYAWHFDGKKWQQIMLPTNEDLENVCCTDEFVYIITLVGEVYKGRDDQWKLIGELAEGPIDTVYAFGKVWISTNFGVWTVDQNDQIQEYDLPEQAVGKTFRLDASYDHQKILGCGELGAVVFDGKEWECLFDLPAFSAQFDQ